MEIFAFIFTVFIGFVVEVVCISSNMPSFGTLVAVAFMGSIILWSVRHKK